MKILGIAWVMTNLMKIIICYLGNLTIQNLKTKKPISKCHHTHYFYPLDFVCSAEMRVNLLFQLKETQKRVILLIK